MPRWWTPCPDLPWRLAGDAKVGGRWGTRCEAISHIEHASGPSLSLHRLPVLLVPSRDGLRIAAIYASLSRQARKGLIATARRLASASWRRKGPAGNNRGWRWRRHRALGTWSIGQVAIEYFERASVSAGSS